MAIIGVAQIILHQRHMHINLQNPQISIIILRQNILAIPSDLCAMCNNI